MLLMLATYGLRSSEVLRLRLEDIQWREERFRVRQSKTGVESFLPLMPAVGEALVSLSQRWPAPDGTSGSIPEGPCSIRPACRARLICHRQSIAVCRSPESRFKGGMALMRFGSRER